MTAQRLQVSRSHDGFVLISDAVAAFGQWKLKPDAARELANQLWADRSRGAAECRGTVPTAFGQEMTFAWPHDDVNLAIADLTTNAMAVEPRP